MKLSSQAVYIAKTAIIFRQYVDQAMILLLKCLMVETLHLFQPICFCCIKRRVINKDNKVGLLAKLQG